MLISYGDIKAKAIYKGDLLLWAKTAEGEYLNGIWDDELLWNDDETWKE